MFKWVSTLILLFLAVVSGAQERSFTVWNKNKIVVSPWNDISIEVAEKVHYKPSSNAISLKYGELIIMHDPKKWFEYGAGLRNSYSNLSKGDWLNENRPMFFVNFSKDMKEFDLVFSNRIEYRMYKSLDNYFRYKQSMKLNLPSLTDWGMRFYISEETFYKMNGIGIHQARFFSGLTAFKKEWVGIKVYYSLERAKSSETWLTGDIVGVNLKFSI
jgi:hypothetical protein